MWQFKRTKKLHEKKMNRKRLKSQIDNLKFSKKNALIELINRAQKKKTVEKKRMKNNFMKI